MAGTIPRDPRAVCIFSPPDLRAWHEQRLGVETANGNKEAGKAPLPAANRASIIPIADR